MPTYAYSCAVHGEFETQQSIKAEPLKECPQCVSEKVFELHCDHCDFSWRPNASIEIYDMEQTAYCKGCNKPTISLRHPIPKKLISLSSFSLKGGGWAKEGYK